MGKLSIILATINDSIATNLTVAQIIHQLENSEIEYEIIIVDNGSNEIEHKNLESFIDFHKTFPVWLYDCKEKGTIPPHSFGVTKATGDYVMMPDPHMVFSTDYFKVMVDTLEKYKQEGFEVAFSPFSVGNITHRGDDFIGGSPLTLPNPFGKSGPIGDACKMGDKPFPVLSNTIASFISTREWFLKIGNMFPEAFTEAGGHTAESLLIGITTWMFGKKCLCQPAVVVEHPVYRTHYGEGRNASMFLSMAVAAYILGGEKYLMDMPFHYGKYADGQLEAIPRVAQKARDYIKNNAVISLDDLISRWAEMRKYE